MKNARFTILVPFLDADGDPTDPTTPDTEISQDGGAFADAAEEVTTISGSNGLGYVTLTGAEMNNSAVGVAFKVASGPKATLMTLFPRVLPILLSGTASAGASGSITLAAGAYDLTGCIVRTTGGTGGGGTGGANNQARVITAYNTSTLVATVSPNWETTPSSDTTYDILLTDLAVNSVITRALRPTTDGRTLDVSSGGEAGLDWANVGSPTTTVDLSGTTIKTTQKVDVETIKTQVVTAAAGVTFPSSIASPTNITAGTITTTTNVTNAPPDSAGVTTLLSRVPSGIFTGITSLAQWLGLIAGKQTGNSTARTEIRATGGGSGTYDETTDSLEANRDNIGTAGAGLTVTAGTVSDKTGYALTSAYDPAKTAAQAGDAMALTSGERTSVGTAVWASATRTLTAISDSSGVTTLLGKFAGITLLAEWLGLIAGKQAGNSTARTELRATGAGSGTYDETTDSQEAIRDRGDAAWADSGTPPSAATVASAVRTELTTELGRIDVATSTRLATAGYTTPPTVGAIADQVWEETLSDHSGTSVSTAAALNAAGSAGDPWNTAIPGSYGAGTAGKIVGDNLNATVSSRAPESGGNVAAIKAKTDNLPATPAATGDAMALTGGERTTLSGVVAAQVTTDHGSGSYVRNTEPPTAAQNATQVRTELTTELGRIDVAISTRLATGGYTAPPSAASIRSEIDTNSTKLDAAVSTRATPAQVNTEVVDALTVDTYAEPGAVPAATSSLKDKLGWLFTLGRNKVTQTSTVQTVRNDADSATIATATVSDDATTFTRGEYS